MASISSNINLDFSAQNTLYASHGLHPFAAKCPPQLVRWAIEHFTQPCETVLDPMAGSGTALAEAMMLGRIALGMDLDPLARLLSKVKSTPIEPKSLNDASMRLLESIDIDYKLLQKACQRRLLSELAERCRPPQINRLDYWFLPEVAANLALIKYHILNSKITPEIRDFFLVTFSSLILARTSVANARDIVHSRHHFRKHDTSPDVMDRFGHRLRVMTRMMTDFWQRCQEASTRHVMTRIVGNDARTIPLSADSIDLVFTSPPYCNALDYVRAHAFTVAWLQDFFQMSQVEYTLLGREYIGTERAANSSDSPYELIHSEIPLVKKLADEIDVIDHHKGAIIKKYFADMWQVFLEMGRVLKPGRHLVVVVCPSHIRKIEIPTHEVFHEMTKHMLFKKKYRLQQVACIQRTINERRRLLPYMQEAFGRRMRTEYVIVFQKVANQR